MVQLVRAQIVLCVLLFNRDFSFHHRELRKELSRELRRDLKIEVERKIKRELKERV